MANLFWAKVAFLDFIKHFRKLSDEQIVEDIKQSMDALEDGDGEGESFGAFMVRSSQERVRVRGEVNRANALAGHEKAGHVIRIEQAGRAKMPTTDELYDFCQANDLDDSLGREWYEMTMSRGGKTRDGLTIDNWKGAVTRYIAARMKKFQKDTK